MNRLPRLGCTLLLLLLVCSLASQAQDHPSTYTSGYTAGDQQATPVQAYRAQEIQPYHAKEIQPARPAQDTAVDRAPSRETGGCGPAPAAAGPGDRVAPLSDGLTLDMNDAQIRRRLGAPTSQSWDARTYSYPGLEIEVGGGDKTIWSVTIKSNCVALHSGITVGSSRSQVASVFGSMDSPLVGQYKLTFAYSAGRVYSIKIEPANGGFQAPSAVSGRAINGAPRPAPGAPDGMAGDWYCVSPSSTVGIIKMDGRGHYTFGENSGTYAISGTAVMFSGIPWNHGHAQLVKGSIEFYYTDGKGYKYYFAFAR